MLVSEELQTDIREDDNGQDDGQCYNNLIQILEESLSRIDGGWRTIMPICEAVLLSSRFAAAKSLSRGSSMAVERLCDAS